MELKYNKFLIEAEYKGDKNWNNDNTGVGNWNNHIVTVTNTETDECCSFDFWMSIARPEMTREDDIAYAFYCFLTDALAAIQSKDEWDFFDEFGYEPSRKSKQVYDACCESAEKAKRVVGDEDTICDLVNNLANQYEL